MSDSPDQELQAVVHAVMQAMNAEFILPLMLGMTTITAALTADPAVGQAVAEHLRRQAETCSPNGRLLLLALARSADSSAAAESPSPSDRLRATLRLIQGGLDAPDTPAGSDR